MRTLLWTTAAAVALVATEAAAFALVAAPNPPVRRAIGSDVVVVGKVTGFEKDLVQAEPYPGAKQKVGYKVAVVKIEDALAGAGKMKEIKIGFIPPAKPDPNANVPGRPIRIPPRGGFGIPELKEGQEFLFFLAKHPTADFYTMPGMSPPVDLKDANAKKEIENVKKITAVLADPMKGLKSDKAETRAETAAVVVTKYRSYPATGGQVDQVAIDADESKLILKALLEGDWSNRGGFRFDGPPTPLMAFQSLGLTEKDGWIPPVIVNVPGAPPVDYGAVQKDAFAKWLDGAGKKYVVKKIVAKPAASDR
jgi:hypothetical protein